MQRQSAISPGVTSGIIKRLIQVACLFAVLATILFTSSGQPGWLWAWVYLGISITGTLVNTLLLIQRSPETIAERGKTGIEHNWEKLIGGLWAIAYFFALPLVAGLSQRFEWTGDLSLTAHLTGSLLFAGGLALVSWAMIGNAYFVTTARIQTERHQHICHTGPYRWIRHPGYLGAILQGLAAPLLFGTPWASIPGALSAFLMIVRTVKEDGMLRQGLEGYGNYTEQVRYRLLPGIW